MLDLTKPVQTRDGRKARVLCIDRVSDKYPVVALVGSNEDVRTYKSDGTFLNDRPDYDLINIPEKKEVWANIYARDTKVYTGTGRYPSEDEASSAWFKYCKQYGEPDDSGRWLGAVKISEG